MSSATHVAPNPTFEAFRQQRIFGSLDGIRAGSILAVIWHHTVPGNAYSLPMLHRGFLGVDMFFVLSGFLIVTLLLREHDRNGSISLRNFYARRTLRIFPVYYAVLAALAVLYLWKPDGGRASTYFAELPYYATYTSNWIDATIFGITWSLATEEQFYLFWPPIERYLKPLVTPILLAVIGFSQLVNFGVLDTWLASIFGDAMEAIPILQTTFTPICLGVLLAHTLHNPQRFRFIARFCGGRYHAILGSVLLLVVCNLPTDDISGWNRLLIHLSMVYLLASLVLRENHALQRLFSHGILRRIGAISYGMYLFHIFAVTVAFKLLEHLPFASPVLGFLLTTLLTVAVAEISFRLFEEPIMRWKKRFSS